jgi:hypothetical protein
VTLPFFFLLLFGSAFGERLHRYRLQPVQYQSVLAWQIEHCLLTARVSIDFVVLFLPCNDRVDFLELDGLLFASDTTEVTSGSGACLP